MHMIPYCCKEKNKNNAILILGFSGEIDEYVYAKIEEFVCKMYGKKNFKPVNELRLELFLQK